MPKFSIEGADQMLAYANQFKLVAGHFYDGEYVQRMAEDLLMLCTTECPVKTGDLLRSHHIAKANIDQIVIEATMYYASWVHDGHFNVLTGGYVPKKWKAPKD
jgi:hypothetical protein